MRLNTTLDNGSIADTAHDILPIGIRRPAPVHAEVYPVKVGEVQVATGVANWWASQQDVDDCHRCVNGPCLARGLACFRQVTKAVTAEEAWDFSDDGCARLTPPPPTMPAGVQA